MLSALLPTSLSAQSILFSDNFDRADNRNIDAVLDGITDNTGASLAADAVYVHPFIDPNNAPPLYGVQDAGGANGGGAQILTNQLQLAVGSGTSNAYIDHNFTNAEILASGGFSVTLDVNGYTQTSRQQGGGFAIGMSKAEAGSATDATGTSGGSNPSLTGAFAADPYGFTGGPVPPQVVSDFWVCLRGNKSLSWGSSTGNVLGLAQDALPANTGTIKVDFFFPDFNAGTTVNYEVFYNGESKGTGNFQWSGTDENYIAVDARDSQFVNLDNLAVATLPPSVNLTATPATVSSAGTSEPVTLDWFTGGDIPAGATYRILDSSLAVIDSGTVTSSTGTFNTSVDGTLGAEIFTIEISDTTPAVIASDDFTVTTADVTITSSTQTAVRLDETGPAEFVTLHLDGANYPAGATYEILDDNGAAVSYSSATSGALSSPLDLDVTVDPSAGSVTFTVLLKDNLGNVFETRTYGVAAVAPAPPILTTLFSDSFDRYEENPADPLNPVENQDIDYSTAGMAGSLAPLDYLEVHEANDQNGGNNRPNSIQINAFNALEAAVGTGMSCWAPDHNFTDAAIATDGAFSVSLGYYQVNSPVDDRSDRYGGFGIGLSAGEVAAFTDEGTNIGSGPRGAIQVTGAPNNIGRGAADFYVSIAHTDMIQVFADGIVVGQFPVDGNGIFGFDGNASGTPIVIRADFAFADPVTFAAGSHVFYKVYCDGLFVTSGYFKLTQSGANFVGLSARASNRVEMDDLTIATVASSDLAYPGDPADPQPFFELTGSTTGAGAITSLDFALLGQPGVHYDLEKSLSLDSFEGYGTPGDGALNLPSGTVFGTAGESGELVLPAVAPRAGYESQGFYRGRAFHWPAP